MIPDESLSETCSVLDSSVDQVKTGVEHRQVKSNGTTNNVTLSNSSIQQENKSDACKVEEFDKSRTYFSGQELIWLNVIVISLFHVVALYQFFTFPYIERWKTASYAWVVAITASFGVGAGAHRLWTHRSYKAKTPLRIILLLCYSTAGMNSLYDWVRDHRVHHKFSETDADPHNSNRGFFFSHVGWLMLRKHPDVKRKGRQIDMSDIVNDPVIKFGEKYFVVLKALLSFILPTMVPVYLWNEDWYYAIMSQVFMRYSYVLNATWCVNSVAHMFGFRPYDKAIAPTENMFISWATGGEGWHNYHHVFPWDYKAAELGHTLDLSTYFINTFARIGWAYDLKQSSPDLVKSIISKKGDGTHFEVPPPEDDNKVT